ncbi:MAG: branched-chain amino acid ABC transporter permease [Acidimicrobiales bacterium]
MAHGYRRTVMAFGLVVVAAALLAVLSAPASAQDDPPPPRFEGTLSAADGPVGETTIEIREVDGDFTASVTTDADGTWSVELPARGATYEVELLVESLPEGLTLADPEQAVLTPRISQPGQLRVVTFDLGSGGSVGEGTGARLAQSLVNGIKFGLIIGMASVGLSLVFATTGLINFAHGELVTFGAALAWWLNTRSLEATLVLATLIAVLGGAALGVGVELGIMRPLRRLRLGPFQFVVVTIGLSLVGRQLFQLWIGEGNVGYRQYRIQQPWSVGSIDLTPRDLAIIATSIVALVAVASTLQLTRMGKAMRAVSDNADLAASSGIAVDGVVLRVWAAGAALAALGGVLFGLSEVVKFDMGFRLLLLIFAAVVLGGLGTAYGAMAGGLVIGIVTEVSTVWIAPELKFVWALAALIVVLLVRPQGILGVAERVG